jgi:hypothetical protein
MWPMHSVSNKHLIIQAERPSLVGLSASQFRIFVYQEVLKIRQHVCSKGPFYFCSEANAPDVFREVLAVANF